MANHKTLQIAKMAPNFASTVALRAKPSKESSKVAGSPSE
jgi:hypothetical protein